MATCPNINLDSWKNLVTGRGEDTAYYLWDKYDGNVPEDEIYNEREIMKLSKELLSNMGVEIQIVDKIVYNGETIGQEGIADVMRGLVQVVRGKEASALPEETMHVVVEIIRQTNPSLFNQLLKEVNNYPEMNQVFKDYSSIPDYQIDGKPNVIKLKQEAIAKVLVNKVIKGLESVGGDQPLTWWQKILEFIKSLFIKSGFDRAAMDVIAGKVGSLSDIRQDQAEAYFQLGDNAKQIKLKNMVLDYDSKLNKETVTIDGVAQERYFYNGSDKPVKTRVSDIVNDFYKQLFRDSQINDTDFESAVTSTYAESGTKFHKDMEHIGSLFVNSDGYLNKDDKGDLIERDDTNYKPLMGNEAFYKMMKTNFRKRLQVLESLNPGSVYLFEKQIYDTRYDKAGTVDFMVITPEGKMKIYDWKLMSLNTEKYDDVPWYKIKAWNIQMKQYKMIMGNTYGVYTDDIVETQMIPIHAKYSAPNEKKKLLPKLISIKIGDIEVNNPEVPYKNVEEAYLLPVGFMTDKTGVKEIDDVISKLNGLYEKISKVKATDDFKKSIKAEQLNNLFSAIRQLMMRRNLSNLIDQFNILNKTVDVLTKRYDQEFKGVDPSLLSNEQIDDFLKDLNNYSITLSTTFSSLSLDLDPIFEKSDVVESDLEQRDELQKASSEAQRLANRLKKIGDDFAENVLAKRGDVESLLTPERIIRGVTAWFGTTSTLQTNAMAWLYKTANKAFYYSGVDAEIENAELEKIKAVYEKHAADKGLTTKTMFDPIKKAGKNELIDEFNPKFYKELKSRIAKQDFEWIRSNIDVAAYKAEVAKILEKELEHIATKPRPRDPDHPTTKAQIKKESERVIQNYSLASSTGDGWLQYKIARHFPLRSKWESDAYVYLKENPEFKAFYDYIIKRNKYFASIGYINNASIRKFLPFIRKTWLESIVFGGEVSAFDQFVRNISIDPDDYGFGQRDPETGELIATVPKYFTSDYSDEYSSDLFRNMSMMNSAVSKFKYLTDIEQQAVLINRVEATKQAIETSFFGNTKVENGDLKYVNDNSVNQKLYQSMMNAIIYNHKYIEDSSFDTVLLTMSDFGNTLNKKLGVNIFPKKLAGRKISTNKMIDWVTNQFTMGALAFNPLTTISTYLGGTFQNIINAGKFYTKTDFVASEFEYASMLFGKDKVKWLAAVRYFLPFTEDYNKELTAKLSVSKFSQDNMQQVLMSWMREADKSVQFVNFLAFLKNVVVIDNNLVNAREYVRSSKKYENLYSLPVSERDKLEAEYEKEVKELIEEKAVMKVSDVVDNKLLIPGVEQKSDSVVEVRRKIQQLTKDALGNLSEDDQRSINFTIQGRSMMVFKNWIPRLVDVRFGDIKYNAGYDAYEWGRTRMMASFLFKNTSASIDAILNYVTGKGDQKWIDVIRQKFEQKKAEYKTQTGKTLKMTETEFVDMVNQNIKNQLVDVAFYLTLTSIFVMLGYMEPGEDEDRAVRNRYKYLMRAVDKVRDEIAFFYDPTQFLSFTTSGIFPAASYLNNIRKAIFNTFNELYAIGIGDEKEQDKNYVLKYYMRGIPIVSQMDAILLAFYPEVAKDLGMKPQSQARPMGL